MKLIKGKYLKGDNVYINIDFITSLIEYDGKYWCNIIDNNLSIEISPETYNKLIETYGRI